MTEDLSDAEYRQLTDHEKSEYWRGRFYDLDERFYRLQQRERKLQGICDRIRDELGGVWLIDQA